MLSEFLDQKLKKANYKILEDETYFGQMPGLRGVWANAKTLEECRTQLREVLEGWLLLKIRDGEKIPGFSFRVDQRALVKHA